MGKDDIAAAVLRALGGQENVLTNTVCMTRLRVTLDDPSAVDYDELNQVPSVLGTATRGNNGLEVVFGPRVIDGIYHAFLALTGIPAGTDALFPMSRQESNMRVQINPAKPATPTHHDEAPKLMDDREMSMLADLFGIASDESSGVADDSLGELLIVNGPNLNMLGIGPADEHEEADFPSLLELCKEVAKNEGFSRCDCVQSNHEGDLVDAVQDAYEVYAGIVLNPSTYGTSKTLRDALHTVAVPAIEVHLHKRERRDTVGTACVACVSGDGLDGYGKAIGKLAEHLRAQS